MLKTPFYALVVFLLSFGIANAQVGGGGVNNSLIKLSGTTIVPANSSWTIAGSVAGATSTNPFIANYFVATSTTATSLFAGPLSLSSTLNGWTPSYGVLFSSGGAPAAAGTGYVPENTITVTGGTFTTASVLAVTATKAVSATVNAGGSGGTDGACTVTGTTGTGTKAQFSGTVSGNALSGALTVAVAGAYLANPTSIAAEPVTGCGLVGATVNMVMGVQNYVVTKPGVYSVAPTSPVSQGSTSGSGTGATFTLSFGTLAPQSSYGSVTDSNVILGNGAGVGSAATGVTIIGFNAGQSLSSNEGSASTGFQTFIGALSGRYNSSGAENTFVGDRAGMGVSNDLLTGGFNVCLGSASCEFMASSSAQNTALGDAALSKNNSGAVAFKGSLNTAVGNSALGAVQRASKNTAVGYNAGGALGNSTGTDVGQNTLIGYEAGLGITTGINNTILGACTDFAPCARLSTGAQNVFIGYDVSQPSASANGQLNISNMIFGTGNTAFGDSISTGRLGVGSTTPWGRVNISLNSGDTNTMAFVIASSTAAATSTLFSVDNQGSVNLFDNGTGTSTILSLSGQQLLNASSSSTIGNLFLGLNGSGSKVTTGTLNTAMGWGAHRALTTGARNTAFGNNAASVLSTASDNTCIGYDACLSVTVSSANANVVVGSLSGAVLNGANATENTFVGYDSGRNVGNGGSNVLLGGESGIQLAGASSRNTFVGQATGPQGVGQLLTDNVLLGYQSGNVLVVGASFNAFAGTQSGLANSSGYDNTFFGALSGENVTSGANNIAIGFNANLPSATASNQLNIGNFIFGTGLTATSSGTSIPGTLTGNLGVASSSPWRTLSVAGTLAVSALSAFAVGDSAICQRAGGEITVDSGVSSCIVSSRTVKHSIVDISTAVAMNRLLKLNPVSFNYNGSNKADLGLIAEDVAAIDSRYAQYSGKTGKPAAINWSAVTADLIKVVQQQQKDIDALKAQVKALKK